MLRKRGAASFDTPSGRRAGCGHAGSSNLDLLTLRVSSPGYRLHLTQLMVLVMMLTFWATSIWQLDRFPPITESEAILAPGYKLFRSGLYGSDLFAGFHGMEVHDFEFMPLMSLLQGASAQFLGVSVWQVRFVSVTLGMLILAQVFALARILTNTSVGVIAMLLLLFWQWTPDHATVPGSGTMLGSGIPLIDIARIPRYDILVPPLGLAALLAWIRGRQTGQGRYDFWSGLLAGLAGLAHLYGLFWVVALLLLLLFERLYFSSCPVFRSLCLILSGTAVAWSIWVGVILVNWDDYTGQLSRYRDRFEVFDLSFYSHNLLAEIHRYTPGVRHPITSSRVGFWVLMTGVPGALLWLSERVVRQRDRRALWLLVPSLLLPLLLALLIRYKMFNYLIMVVPLFAILLAWGLVRLLHTPWPGRRIAVLAIMGLLVVQGAAGIGYIHMVAGQMMPPEKFFMELRRVIPPSGRIIGPPQYWIGLIDREYRSFGLLAFLANPRAENPISFDEAMTQVAPQIVLMHPLMTRWLTDCSTPLDCTRSEQFWTFMRRHRARVIGEVRDPDSELIQIYQLDSQ